MEETTKEACKLWCPMFRVGSRLDPNTLDSSQLVDNRMSQWLNPNCIANKCMMWEWVNGTKDFGYCGLSVLR